MPQSAIDRQNAWRAAMELYFSSGNAAMNDLVQALGGNPVAGLAPGQGDAGVPTSGVPFIANGVPIVIPGPAAAPPSAWNPKTFLPARGLRRGGGDGGKGGAPSAPCVYPTVLPLVTVFPVPAVAAAPPPAAAPRPVVIPTPAVAAPKPCPDPAECAPTPANVCRNLRNGCYNTSQLSPAQVLACSQAGWAGNLNLYPCTLAKGGWSGGQFIGDVNLSPAPYQGAGVGDLTTQPGAGVFWGSVGLALFGLYAAREFGKKKGR